MTSGQLEGFGFCVSSGLRNEVEPIQKNCNRDRNSDGETVAKVAFSGQY
jgi:hypothetical protein